MHVNIESLVLARLIRSGSEGSIVTRLLVPLAMVVITHHMDIVKILVHSLNIICSINGARGSA